MAKTITATATTAPTTQIPRARFACGRDGGLSTGVLDIVVLAGGPGPEREVSLNSGRNIRDALKRLDHHAIMLEPEVVHLGARLHRLLVTHVAHP